MLITALHAAARVADPKVTPLKKVDSSQKMGQTVDALLTLSRCWAATAVGESAYKSALRPSK